ncbi:hypothetical protein LSUB1_G005370 [Lachnellula subtilissima]|uniref:Uncharacterized protein n=1 Tax=Lachnellula subtilissima TaxID=602034 RepID=A0A8H8RGZ1_9HELO|nr:hypothetical protein LSUB1_G005370 [Lachnellula subtilissima]
MRQILNALRKRPSQNLSVRDTFLGRWHGMLNLRRHSPPSWYPKRLDEEILEVTAANSRRETHRDIRPAILDHPSSLRRLPGPRTTPLHQLSSYLRIPLHARKIHPPLAILPHGCVSVQDDTL